jgi:hypothetical protein
MKTISDHTRPYADPWRPARRQPCAQERYKLAIAIIEAHKALGFPLPSPGGLVEHVNYAADDYPRSLLFYEATSK